MDFQDDTMTPALDPTPLLSDPVTHCRPTRAVSLLAMGTSPGSIMDRAAAERESAAALAARQKRHAEEP
ncbi:hypothetical protein Hypma_010817 [Hypsizygus marmoreus]|uniref:Uncharacterized protein n=1 Tax=Hypsizygus marmoreus TaxID=39966 RepID=A0A369JTG0_HYPMA|nr:hypothetical protein Hypma_010817 [Hypsizygus marmoreus]